MKRKKEKVLSLVLCIAVILSSMFAFNFSFSVFADDNTGGDTTSSTPTTTVNNTLPTDHTTTTTTTTDHTTTTTNPTTKPTTTKPTTKPTTTKPVVKPISVGNISNLKVSKIASNYITVKWNKSKNATNYKVEYRKVGSNQKWYYVNTVKSNTANVTKLSENTLYYIKVTPMIVKDKKNYYGKNATVKSSTATSKVTGLKVTDNGKKISIKWNRNKNVTGYKVYRASGVSNGKYVYYKTIKKNSTTTFTDNKVSTGKIYYYKLKAYRTYNNYGTVVSNYSNAVMSTCGLYATTVKTKSELSKITVTWSKVPAATGYKVYQSTNSNRKSFKCVAKTTSRSFTTGKLSRNKTYYFQVQPYKTYKGKELKPTVSPKIKSQKATSTIFGQDVGNTYIEINIKQQHMWFYINGKLYVDTPVVTGMADGVHDTPKGVHTIFVHQSPSRLVGDTWDVVVQYWMQFTADGCGIHDSTWRASYEYGGNTYLTNGSHGCVNTPLDKVAKIFKKAHNGTIVVVH